MSEKEQIPESTQGQHNAFDREDWSFGLFTLAEEDHPILDEL